MKNEAKIKGNKNYIIQGNKDSKLNAGGNISKGEAKNKYAMIAIIVAAIGVIVSIIIG